jgi:TRAP-type mannitol/chloroaromatic compound transport system substrate-binding protein
MSNTTRRSFLKKTTQLGAAAAAATLAAPHVASAQAKTRTLKLQSSWSPGTTGYKLFETFCNSMVELSGGEIAFKPFPEGSIAGDFQTYDAVRNGVIDGQNIFWTRWPSRMPAAVFLTSFPLSPARPDVWDTAYYSYGLIDIARELYAKNGLFFVGNVHHDLNLIHSKNPIRSLDDFKGVKIRMPGGMIAESFAAIGARTTLLPGSEVYPALEKGTIDAADFVGPAINYDLGFHQVTKYVIMGPASMPTLHQAVDPMDIAFSMRVWKSLSAPMQKLIEAATHSYSLTHYTGIQKANVAAWPKYKAAGNEVIHLTEADVEAYRKVVVPLWFKWANKDKDAARVFKIHLEVMQNPSFALLDPADIAGHELKF